MVCLISYSVILSKMANGYMNDACHTCMHTCNSFCSLQSLGCFTVKGNFSSHEHSHHSKSKYDPDTNTITVKGAQIIGWICTMIPKFPAVSAMPEMTIAHTFNEHCTATVQLETLTLTSRCITGCVTVANIAYEKYVYVRWTVNGWKSYSDTSCTYESSDESSQRDIFTFELPVLPPIELCICYTVQGQTFYDNNNTFNYSFSCTCN